MSGIERSVDKLGRIVLPVRYRKKLGINTNDTVIVSLEDNVIIISPVKNICVLCASSLSEPSKMRLCKECINKIKEGQ